MPNAPAREGSAGEGRAAAPPAALPVPPDPPPDLIASVFDRWDTMIERAGLPGPVTRDGVRAAAITARLAEHGDFRVLAAIDAVGRSDFLVGQKKRGQSDFRATFDWVFEVRRFRGSGVFTRLLDGDFGEAAVPRSPPGLDRRARGDGVSNQPAKCKPPPDSPAVAPFRAALRARLGPAAQLFDAVGFDLDGPGELMVRAATDFLREDIESRFAGDLALVAAAVFGRPMRLFFRVAAQPVSAFAGPAP